MVEISSGFEGEALANLYALLVRLNLDVALWVSVAHLPTLSIRVFKAKLLPCLWP